MPTLALPFPALVTGPDASHWPMARPRLTAAGTLQVFAYERASVRLVAEAPVTDVKVLAAGSRWCVETPDGPWLVEKGRGCGCGHPLKRANLDRIAAAASA